jgi:pimeloyl-ACP methyl ester carboxylesterase
VPHFTRGEVSLYYEENGAGFPILLIAPGGMKSAIPFWANAPWNPVTELSGRYRVIAMDQRNAGRSSAPISASDGWHTYTRDQLDLMDHLGIDRFHVAGMCIGGPYCLGLIEAAPERVASAVLFQTIGLTDNRAAFYAMFDGWADELRTQRAASPQAWRAFREAMYGGDRFLFNVDEQFLEHCETPLLVLKGDDLYHPAATSLAVARLAPNARLIERWKAEEDRAAAIAAVAEFLAAHTPG